MMLIAFLLFGSLALVLVLLGRPDAARGRAVGFVAVLLFAGSRVQLDRLGGIVTLAVVLLLLVGFVRKSPVRAVFDARFAVLVALWVALMFAELVAPRVAMQTLVQVAVLSIATGLLAVRFTQSDWGSFRRILIFNGWLQVAFAVVEVVVGRPVWGYGLNRHGTGLFVQSNQLIETSIPRLEGATGHSIVLGVAITLALICLWFERRGRNALVTVLVMAPLGLVFLLSGSRSVFLALLIVFLYLVLSPSAQIKTKWKVLVALIVGAAAVVTSNSLWLMITDFMTTGSFMNRLESLDSVATLFSRPLFEVVFGSGLGSLDRLYDFGYIQQSTDFRVIDNLLVTIFAIGGLLSVALLVSVFTLAWVKANVQVRALLVVFIIMFFSFDYITWYSCMAVLSVLLVVRPQESSPKPDPVPTVTNKTGRKAVPIRAMGVVRR